MWEIGQEATSKAITTAWVRQAKDLIPSIDLLALFFFRLLLLVDRGSPSLFWKSDLDFLLKIISSPTHTNCICATRTSKRVLSHTWATTSSHIIVRIVQIGGYFTFITLIKAAIQYMFVCLLLLLFLLLPALSPIRPFIHIVCNEGWLFRHRKLINHFLDFLILIFLQKN